VNISCRAVHIIKAIFLVDRGKGGRYRRRPTRNVWRRSRNGSDALKAVKEGGKEGKGWGLGSKSWGQRKESTGSSTRQRICVGGREEITAKVSKGKIVVKKASRRPDVAPLYFRKGVKSRKHTSGSGLARRKGGGLGKKIGGRTDGG